MRAPPSNGRWAPPAERLAFAERFRPAPCLKQVAGEPPHNPRLRRMCRHRLAARVRPGVSSEAAIILKNRVQQNLGSGGAFLEARRFRFVMADALEAGDEDHGGRSYSRHIDRIMAGARHHIARRQARFLGRPPHAADQLRRETNGRRCPDLLFLIGQSQRIEDRRQRKSHALLHLFEDIVLPMSSRWRRSMVKKTSPGTTLRLFGLFSMRPTVATPRANSRPMASTAAITRAAPSKAFLRRYIGVAPVWACSAQTVTSYHLIPCTPVSTPMVAPAFSRIGPCSI